MRIHSPDSSFALARPAPALCVSAPPCAPFLAAAASSPLPSASAACSWRCAARSRASCCSSAAERFGAAGASAGFRRLPPAWAANLAAFSSSWRRFFSSSSRRRVSSSSNWVGHSAGVILQGNSQLRHVVDELRVAIVDRKLVVVVHFDGVEGAELDAEAAAHTDGCVDVELGCAGEGLPFSSLSRTIQIHWGGTDLGADAAGGTAVFIFSESQISMGM